MRGRKNSLIFQECSNGVKKIFHARPFMSLVLLFFPPFERTITPRAINFTFSVALLFIDVGETRKRKKGKKKGGKKKE